MAKRVTVLALIKAKPGKEEATKQALLAMVPPTRQEEGCLNYDLHQSTDDPTQFMFYENWVSKEDLDQHLNTPHLVAFREKAGDLLERPTEITLWEMITEQE